jgi:hypothetical protein
MDIQDHEYQLTDREKKLYFIGVIVFAVLFLLTIILGSFFSPLMLLQVRLGLVGTGLVYNLAIYVYYQRLFKKKKINIAVIEKEQQNEIIICFNGRELGRR